MMTLGTLVLMLCLWVDRSSVEVTEPETVSECRSVVKIELMEVGIYFPTVF